MPRGPRALTCPHIYSRAQPYSTHTLPALRDWLGKLSSEAPAVGGESDERASSAIVDEQAVEQARKVAEWETFEVDQVP